MAMILYSLIYFVFGRVIWEVILSMEAVFTYPEPMASSLNILKYVIALHPIFAIFGWLLYGFINSQRRGDRTEL